MAEPILKSAAIAQVPSARERERASGAGSGFSGARMLTVARKELRSYFAFPLVYVLAGIFAALVGY